MYEEYDLHRLDLAQTGLINLDQYLHNMLFSFLKELVVKEGIEETKRWIEEWLAGEA